MLNKGPLKAQRIWHRAVLMGCLLLLAGSLIDVHAARRAKKDRDDSGGGAAEFAAKRLLKTGTDLLLAGEEERGVEVMKKIIDQFPETNAKFEAYLALGRHFIDVNKQQEAVGYLGFLREMEDGGKTLSGDELNILLEGLFLMGKAQFQMRQYTASFPVLRKITNNYPNTVWANEAYYYIGLSHFAQENWNMAIESLSKVGTYIDPDSDAVEYVEAGQRFYVKIEDGDLPVRFRLGEEVRVKITTKGGDEETVTCIPMAGDSEVFIGSVPTVIGKATKGDNNLQVIGGDTISTTYVDANDKEGGSNIPRRSDVKVVSSATVTYTRGDLETRAQGAYIGQPVYVVLTDTDLDKGPGSDTVQVRILSRYLPTEEESEGSAAKEFDLASFLREQSAEDRYQIRDELTITLDEQGKAPIHSGEFVGELKVTGISDEAPVDKNDTNLSCNVGDEIVVTYSDELHINGDAPREISVAIAVLSEIESAPRATQYVVSDPIVRSKKYLVEATAYLELGRIFKSMGLREGAEERCDAGLELVNSIIRSSDPIPRASRENAFRLKWELEIAKDDFNAAIGTCRVFNRLYPHSPLVDQALLGIAEVKYENEKYDEAMRIYKQIISLPHSLVKPQAQFRIAEAMENNAQLRRTSGGNDAAIAQYKLVADRYPDSEYAGPSLGKLIDYYLETRDYARADDLLEQVFNDHPDADFLDSMLLKWVLVAYRMGDFRKAHEKCSQLIFDYPTSNYAGKAKSILPKIEAKIQ